MNKAVKIGLITLATISVMTVGVVIFKKKLSKKALPPTVQNVELTPEAKAILTEANKYVGIKEVGDNAGFSDADFEKKMKNIGWVKGRAYCAAFVRFVLLNIAKGNALQFFKTNATQHSATTFSLFKNAASKKSEYVEIISKPEPGCIILYNGHTEICESDIDGSTVNVISANSKFSDGSEGVVRRTRTPKEGIKNGNKIEEFLGFVRIKKLS
ncbi:MAG: CHAP domain-containing protein [Bacteroidales bacterium]|nr:CHAP domain-containing protein [Bacteroidales bacterium]